MGRIEPLECRIAPAVFVVSTAADSGAGSLRQAILDANALEGADVITFGFTAGTVTTITLSTALPSITDSVSVDASSLLREEGGILKPGIELSRGTAPVSASGLNFQPTADGSAVKGLSIYSFSDGIVLLSDASVENCFIGLKANGTDVPGNERNGIYVSQSEAIIGGTNKGNVIAGSAQNGIHIVRGEAQILNNVIGLNAELKGTFQTANDFNGIYIDRSPESVVRWNIVGGNGQDGINIESSDSTMVQGNYVGLIPGDGASEVVKRSNGGNGILVRNSSIVRIGGFDPSTDNIVSGNLNAGIRLVGVDTVEVYNNSVGTNEAGNSAVQNNHGGIALEGVQQAVIVNNIISGNRFTGLLATMSSSLRIEGNKIGLGFGDELLGNTGEGIKFDSETTSSWIGNALPGTGNRFGPNAGGGIVIKDGSGITIRDATFVGSIAIPIDLGGDGVTPNDFNSRDADTGANGLQNSPKLLTAYTNRLNQVEIEAQISGPAGREYRLEFYSASANGAPETRLGIHEVTTDEDGIARSERAFPGVVSGTRIVALATDLTTGETSEVSSALEALPALKFDGFTVLTEGNTGTTPAFFKVYLSAVPTSPVVVHYSLGGTAVHGVDINLPSGTLTFAPGTTQITLPFEVPGDTLVEPNKTFFLSFDSVEGAYISAEQGPVGTLKDDDTSFVISEDMRSATWVDVDGDLVTLKVNKKLLSPHRFVFVNEGDQGGQRLVSFEFPGAGSKYVPFKPLDLSITAKSANGGDGFVNVGTILPGDVYTDSIYRKIVIDGDLGSLSATSIGSLTAASLGVAAADVSGDFTSEIVITKKLGSLKIAGDVVQTKIEAQTVGSVKIGGDFDRSSLSAQKRIGSFSTGSIIGGESGLALRAGGNIGPVKVSGDITGLSPALPVIIQAGADFHGAKYAISNLLVKGDVENARILAGDANRAGESLGPITVKGSWIASLAAASIDPGEDGLYGTEDDSLAGTEPADPRVKTIARIAKITVAGSISGTVTDGDSFGFFARKLGPIRVAGSNLLPGLVAGTDDVRVAAITATQA